MKTYIVPNDKLQEWDELTESNAHGLRLQRIADYMFCCSTTPDTKADLYEITQMLNTINSLHDRRRSLSGRLWEIRETLRKQLRNAIKSEFGEAELKRINP